MTDLPQGYEPHEIPADYTGKLFIEGQMRAFAKAETMRLRDAAEWALEALTQASVLCADGTSTRRSVDDAMDALREALGDEE